MKNGNLSKKFDTFIFDWDGTLTRVVLLRKLNERLNPRWAYKKKVSRDLIDEYSVQPPKNMNTLAGKAITRHIKRVEAERRMGFLADISLYLFRPHLQVDARAVLDKLRDKGVTIALFTNGAKWRVLRELSYLKVEDYFSAIVSAQDFNTLKPNPLGLKVIVKALHSDNKRTIYIGDMVSDIEAAKYAGLHSCAVSNGFDDERELRGAKPEYLFGSLEGLTKSL